MGSEEPVHYKVAEAARLAGVSASTLRLWETQGLVIPGRSDTGHRQYSADDVVRLKRIAWFRTERGLNPAAIREALEAEDPAVETHPSEGDAPQGVGRKLRSLRHAEGKTLEQVAGEEADAYFDSRPLPSRLACWASEQSQVISGRGELEARLALAKYRFLDAEPPRPQGWGGYRVIPHSLEFWQGRADRLHDRLRYQLTAGGWRRERLAP